MVITLSAAFLCFSLVLAGAPQDRSRFGFAVSIPPLTEVNREPEVTCEKIAKAISSKSQVFYPGERAPYLSCTTHDSEVLGSQGFKFDISHWANTSSQVPVCSVEPGTPDDVGLTVNLTLPPSTNPCIADVLYAHSYRRLL